ncbi:MAG: AAA family ATPase [Pirellulaceae bacterium]|nr:AAA family ATPase [Planctomycetales bacterium]
MERETRIDGVRLVLARQHDVVGRWIGQHEVLRQLLACWLVVNEADLPLTPRLIGSPGIGKTALVMAASQMRKQPLFIYQCTADTRPEDLLVTPVLGEQGRLEYHASPLVTAMITGGVCLLDEGNRMNEKSWASLAPLLDQRRYIESIVAGITVQAHPDFRCAVTMNQDESTFEIPDYILSRLQPSLHLGFPSRDDEKQILEYHLPFAAAELVGMTVDFLQSSHELRLDFSPRDGINILRYAMKRMAQDPDHPLSHDAVWRESVQACLGDEALDLEAQQEKRARRLGMQAVSMGLEDLLFDLDDPLRDIEGDDDDSSYGDDADDDDDDDSTY